jgi:hypothetical protein
MTIRRCQELKIKQLTPAGAAVMAAGIASNNRDLFDWAASKPYQTFLQQIRPNSTLPSEASRRQKATLYHAMSASGLTVMAYLSSANNVDLYSQGNFALRRLNLLVAE